MNRIYRTVWSQARACLVVAHEKAGSGAARGAVTTLAQCVAAALLSLGAGPAQATDQVVTTALGSWYTIADGDALSISGTGSVIDVNYGLPRGVLFDDPAAATTAGFTIGYLENAGSIQGNTGGVMLTHTTVGGAVANSGFIEGINFALTLSHSSVAGGVSNAATGTLVGAGGYWALDVADSQVSGGVVNAGHIQAVGTDISITASAISGGVMNSAGATLSGGLGLNFFESTLAGDVSNAGMIGGGGIAIGDSTVNGDIVNSGTNTGAVFLRDSALDGRFSNSGALGSLAVVGGSVSGGLTNTGMLQSSAPALLVLASAANVGGGLSNSGTISGTERGIEISSGSSLSGGLTNVGSIDGERWGVLVVDGSSLAGGFTNSGTLSTRYSALIVETNSTLSGGVHNSGAILGGSGASAIWVGSGGAIVGGLSNSGTIAAGSNGVVLYSGSTLSGGLTNSGTIVGAGTGIEVRYGSTLAGGLTNSGSIGGNAGIDVGSGSILAGGVVNSGSILGAVFGVDVWDGSTLSGGLSNSGTIVGLASAGVAVRQSAVLSGGITNSGAIGGTLAGILVETFATLDGGVQNSGVIVGLDGGVFVVSNALLAGGLTNSGTIFGLAHGIVASQGGTLSGGITNSGTIFGVEGTGIAVASYGTIVGGVTNSGTIGGAVNAVHVAPQGELDAIVIEGNNAAFLGDVNAPNTAVTLAAGATFSPGNAFDVASFGIEPGALLSMGLMPSSGTLAGGITGQVTNAGTLALTGVVNGAAITAQITGSYTQAASGSFVIGAASDTNYNKLTVSGAVALPGEDRIYVNVASVNTLALGQTLTGVIDAGTLSASSFDVAGNSYMIGFSGMVNANGHMVNLVTTLSGSAQQAVTSTGNNPGQGAAQVLDNALTNCGSMCGVIGALEQLPTAQALSNAVSETLPVLDGATARAAAAAVDDISQIIQARIETSWGLSAGDAAAADAHMWVKPFASWADQGDNNGAPGYKAQSSGVVVGADAVLSPQARVGVGFAYADSGINASSSVAPSSARVEMYRLIGYGSYDLGDQEQLNWQGDLGTNDTSEQRAITFIGATAASSYDSVAAHARAGLGKLYALSPTTTLVPSLDADYAWVRNAAYSESGAGALDLNVAAQTTQQLIGSGDAKLTHELAANTTLLANFGLGYDVLARQNAVTASFAGDPTAAFTTLGAKPDPWVERLGVGLNRVLSQGVEFSANLDTEHRSGFNNRSASVKLRWLF